MTATPLAAPVAAVTFDLDFTLWDITGVIGHAEQVCHGLLEQRYPAVAELYDVEAMRALRAQIAGSRPEIAHDVTELRRVGLRQAGLEAGLAGDRLEAMVDEAFDVFLEARHAVRLYDDAMPILQALHGRVPIGAVTNGNADVGRIGMGHYFDFALSAVELGAAKPSHLVFETVANRSGVPIEQIVHVGDDVHCDVYGAAQAGMQAVWLNRDGAEWPAEVPRVPHHPVTNLAELEGMLLGLIGART